MRRFLVGFLATIGALALLAAGGVAVLAWRLVPHAPSLPARIVLTVDLRGGLDEVAATQPLSVLGLPVAPTLSDVVLALDQAGNDPRVRGLVARLSGEGPGLAQAQELRAAIARFREHGKFAYAHSESFGEFGPGTRGYYLATAFEQIQLQPLGALGLTGILIETPLLRGLLDKIGAEPSGDKRGAYKTAADMFTDFDPDAGTPRVAELARQLPRPADPGRHRRRPGLRCAPGRLADRPRAL